MLFRDNIQKTCGFYVSDFHFVTMLLPHIVTEIEKGTKVDAILCKNIRNEIKEVVSKLNINDIVRAKILNINWNKISGNDFNSIKFYMENIEKNNNIEIIVSGTKNEIDIINKNIEYWIDINIDKLEDVNLNIINCYEVTEFNSNINNILNEHNYIINTSGIQAVEQIFEGRKKKIS